MKIKFFFVCVFQELDLSNNYLDNLPAGLFRDMSNLTRLTLHNNSLTVMDRDLFQVGTVDYTKPYLVQSIVQLSNKAGKGLQLRIIHKFHTVIPKIFPLKIHVTVLFICHVLCELYYRISQSTKILCD